MPAWLDRVLGVDQTWKVRLACPEPLCPESRRLLHPKHSAHKLKSRARLRCDECNTLNRVGAWRVQGYVVERTLEVKTALRWLDRAKNS